MRHRKPAVPQKVKSKVPFATAQDPPFSSLWGDCCYYCCHYYYDCRGFCLQKWEKEKMSRMSGARAIPNNIALRLQVSKCVAPSSAFQNH
mmetsp:Transcript_4778/g.6135  ORF Transcript_4778/g.6135 Transcript_4778/m.6135 type:complete len:90 (-) Transcript_4778:29-298(-)